MRVPIWGATLLLGLLVPGCFLCPKAEAIRVMEVRDTPELAFLTIRSALRAGTMDVLYRGLSERFKGEYGDLTQRELTVIYNTHRSDFDDLLVLLDSVEVGDLEKRYATRDGIRYARVKISKGDAFAVFLLRDFATWTAKIQFEGYSTLDESTHKLNRGGFPEILRVDEGMLHVAPLDLTDDGLTDVSEVVGLKVSHDWLLDGIEQLVNVSSLLETLKSEGAKQ